MDEKLEILKSEMQQMLKKGEALIQQIPLKAQWVRQLHTHKEWIQHIPPTQLYVAIAVVFITIFLLFIGIKAFATILVTYLTAIN